MKTIWKVLIAVVIIMILSVIVIFAYIKLHPKIAVLCYHNVATAEEKANFLDENDWTITVDNFEEQLIFLGQHGYKTLTTQEFYDWKQGTIELPYKSVLITFDDGFLSNYHYVFPLLKKYNMNAVVFTVGEFIDNSDTEEWTGNIKTYMTKELLEKVKEEYPNIEICSHSYALHRDRAIEQEETVLKEDMEMFNEKIENTTIYAYPFGKYNENMINALKKANYKLAFIYGPTNKEYRKTTRNDSNYEIPRLNVSHGMNIWKFGLRLLMPF